MAASIKLCLLAVSCALVLATACHGLQVGYYRKTCPRAEALVRAEVKKAVRANPGVGAGLIRMLFHDCFVEGCDASVLLDPTQANPQPEKLGAPNNPSLRGYEVIDAAKAAVEKACPDTVSCADIIAFAGRDASYLLSHAKVSFHMPAGRLDGRKSLASETLTFLPGPSSNLSSLVSAFAAKGLSVEDVVVLSGAHSIGRSHCSSFVQARLSSPSDIATSLATMLRKQCPANPTTGNDPTVSQDVVSPHALDNQYYKNLLARKVLFTSDATLLSAPNTARMVRANARFAGSWEKKFAKAMVKMGAIGVKTGRDGEIRRSCRLVN
ncbi:hypothetical protein GQ55_5G326200 [Panicum hallii var. hallii]|jgi:peroxidase|uniref:Peroxidase n=2 Tax=Panicum hallii TaxID=206008 RepID=A0A2T7DLT4_9POAL|nr:peroxidase 2-like [Panicum hallii]PUZ56537.1 hypothetical protein GQ55_5G326200 [Panicum hallii var. hallii]PVH35016.1 hypothetical protein PAHAL_7G086600 [Panicum hallii]